MNLNTLLRALPETVLRAIQKHCNGTVGHAMFMLTFAFDALPTSPRQPLGCQPDAVGNQLTQEFCARYLTSRGEINWTALQDDCHALHLTEAS